jgi:hypothetical protein
MPRCTNLSAVLGKYECYANLFPSRPRHFTLNMRPGNAGCRPGTCKWSLQKPDVRDIKPLDESTRVHDELPLPAFVNAAIRTKAAFCWRAIQLSDASTCMNMSVTHLFLCTGLQGARTLRTDKQLCRKISVQRAIARHFTGRRADYIRRNNPNRRSS